MACVRWLGIASVLSVGSSFGCSSPPSPPPQAALTIAVEHSGGNICTASSGQQEDVPAGMDTYGELLSCDLSMGCKPDQTVVVDGAGGSQVTCTVGADGNVSLLFVAQGAQFTATSTMETGPLTATGGKLDVIESNPYAMTPLEDKDCVISIEPNRGVLKPGAIWAAFNCANLQDPTAPMGSQICAGTGAFIFENCSK